MLFILTNAEDATATFLVDQLAKAKIPFVRLDTDSIVSTTQVFYRLTDPILRVNGSSYRPGDVSNVWYRRPKKLEHPGFGDSAEGDYTRQEWTEAIESFFAHVAKRKWMNHPASNAAASHKLEQLTSATTMGLKVPETIVTQDPAHLEEFFMRHQGQIVVKPMATGYVERDKDSGPDSLIYTNRVTTENLADLADVVNCPTLFQEYVSKQCDVRLTVVDSSMHAVSLSAWEKDGSSRCDIRRNNMSDVVYERIDLPSDVSVKIKGLMRAYSLRFAAIDFVVNSTGEWVFLEINPNGQWAWLEQCAHIRISDSFVKAFANDSPR